MQSESKLGYLNTAYNVILQLENLSSQTSISLAPGFYLHLWRFKLLYTGLKIAVFKAYRDGNNKYCPNKIYKTEQTQKKCTL